MQEVPEVQGAMHINELDDGLHIRVTFGGKVNGNRPALPEALNAEVYETREQAEKALKAGA